MDHSMVAVGLLNVEGKTARPAFLAVPFAVALLLLAGSEIQGQAAIAVTPETQTVEEGSHAYIDVSLTAQPDENVTVGMFRSSTKLSAPRPLNLAFTTENWNTLQTVRWKALPDDDPDDEEVGLTLYMVEDRNVFARATVRILDDEGVAMSPIGLCDARLSFLAPNRGGEELDICWETGMEIPADREVVIEARRKSSWDDPLESFSPWREVGSGDWYTRCGGCRTCAQYTVSGLWRGFAMTLQMRIRRGEHVLAISPELQVQAPNGDSAELNAELTVIPWPSSEGERPAGRFLMELVFTDPLVHALTTELVQGLEASDFEVSNGTVTDAGYWDGGTYKVVVEPEVQGQPVTISLRAATVKGVGAGVSASGGNNYTRDNTASNVVVEETGAPE